jgi:phytoene dehydrogenase-like protein
VTERLDAAVVGSGPNGLSAAIVLARAGFRVAVFEAAAEVGGGLRSAPLTLPGFVHDVCSAVHPLAVASPFFKSLPLAAHGLEWIEPPVMFAHPFEDGSAAAVRRAVDDTAAELASDGAAYRRIFEPIVANWHQLESLVLAPPAVPRHPFAAARFALHGLRSAEAFASRTFRRRETRGLFAGAAAHGMIPLDRPVTAGFGLVLTALAHAVGWVFPRGGAQQIANALAACLRSLGGEIHTGTAIASIDALPPARAVLCDLSPRPFLRIAGHRLPAAYRRRLERYRYGLGAFKVDWALDAPIPWRSERCAEAGTVHLGGTIEEIARAERSAWAGRAPDRPFVLLAQPSRFDPTRAPVGKHTVWAYCHVPHGSTTDMLPAIEAQIERVAPGFRERVLARHVMGPAALEEHNPNYVGGDIAAGVSDVRQMLARPTLSWYSTPCRGLYLCSASTPPGVGVHGMCGYYAAERVLKRVLREP